MRNICNICIRAHRNNIMLAILVIGFAFFNITLNTSYAIPVPDKTSTESSVIFVENIESADELASFDSKELSANIKYPEIARKMGIQGRVIAKVLVSKEGKAKNVEIIESVDEMFDKPAKQAISQLKFVPGKKEGNPIDSWISIPVDFIIEK